MDYELDPTILVFSPAEEREWSEEEALISESPLEPDVPPLDVGFDSFDFAAEIETVDPFQEWLSRHPGVEREPPKALTLSNMFEVLDVPSVSASVENEPACPSSTDDVKDAGLAYPLYAIWLTRTSRRPVLHIEEARTHAGLTLDRKGRRLPATATVCQKDDLSLIDHLLTEYDGEFDVFHDAPEPAPDAPWTADGLPKSGHVHQKGSYGQLLFHMDSHLLMRWYMDSLSPEDFKDLLPHSPYVRRMTLWAPARLSAASKRTDRADADDDSISTAAVTFEILAEAKTFAANMFGNSGLSIMTNLSAMASIVTQIILIIRLATRKEKNWIDIGFAVAALVFTLSTLSLIKIKAEQSEVFDLFAQFYTNLFKEHDKSLAPGKPTITEMINPASFSSNQWKFPNSPPRGTAHTVRLNDRQDADEPTDSFRKYLTSGKVLGSVCIFMASLMGIDCKSKVSALSASLNASKGVSEMVISVAEDFFGVDISGKKAASDLASALSKEGEMFLGLPSRDLVGKKLLEISEWKKNTEQFLRNTKSTTINTADLATVLTKVADRIAKARIAAANSIGRPCPTAALFYGEKGRGKTSAITNYIIPELNYHYGLSEEEGKTYHLAAGGHFQGMRDERWAVMDETGAATKPNVTEAQLNQMIGEGVCIAPGAAIEDKEQQVFWNGIFFSSNFSWHEMPLHETNKETRAAFRSRCLTFEVIDENFVPGLGRYGQTHRKDDYSHLTFWWRDITPAMIPLWLNAGEQYRDTDSGHLPGAVKLAVSARDVVQLLIEDIDAKQQRHASITRAKTERAPNPNPARLWSPRDEYVVQVDREDARDDDDRIDTYTPVYWISSAPGRGKSTTLVPALEAALETYRYNVVKAIPQNVYSNDAFILDDIFDPNVQSDQKMFKALYDKCNGSNIIFVVCNFSSGSWVPFRTWWEGTTSVPKELFKGFWRRSGLGTKHEFKWYDGELYAREDMWPLPGPGSFFKWFRGTPIDVPAFINQWVTHVHKSAPSSIVFGPPPQGITYDVTTKFEGIPGLADIPGIIRNSSFSSAKALTFANTHLNRVVKIASSAGTEGIRGAMCRGAEYMIRNNVDINAKISYTGGTASYVQGRMYLCEQAPTRVQNINKEAGTFEMIVRGGVVLKCTRQDFIDCRDKIASPSEANREVLSYLIVEKNNNSLDWHALSDAFPDDIKTLTERWMYAIKKSAETVLEILWNNKGFCLFVVVLCCAISVLRRKSVLRLRSPHRCPCHKWTDQERLTTVCPHLLDDVEDGKGPAGQFVILPNSKHNRPIHASGHAKKEDDDMNSGDPEPDDPDEWGSYEGQQYLHLENMAKQGYTRCEYGGKKFKMGQYTRSRKHFWVEDQDDEIQCKECPEPATLGGYDKIANNCLGLYKDKTGTQLCHITMITPTIGVTVRHIVVNTPCHVRVDGRQYPLKLVYEDVNREMCILNSDIPIPGIKDIRGNMLGLNDIRRITWDATILMRTEKGLKTHTGRYESQHRVAPAFNNDYLSEWGTNVGVISYASINAPTSQGMCGMPIVSTFGGKVCILGVHAATRLTIRKLASNTLSIQLWNNALKNWKLRLDEGQSTDLTGIPQNVERLPEAEQAGIECYIPKAVKKLFVEKNPCKTHFEPYGALNQIANVDCRKPMDPRSKPTEMDYFKETIKDMDKKVPAMSEPEAWCYLNTHKNGLMPVDGKGQPQVFLIRMDALAQNYYSDPEPIYHQRAREIGKYFNALLPGKQLNPISVKDAISGSNYGKPMEPKAAVGWCTQEITGCCNKGSLMDIQSGEWRDTPAGRWCHEMAKAQWELAGQGKRLTIPGECQYKAETLPEEKCFKKRIVDIVAPITCANFKRLSDPIQHYFSSQKMKSPLIFSMNAVDDWDSLYQELDSFADDFLALDVSSFDHNANGKLLMCLADWFHEMFLDPDRPDLKRPLLYNRLKVFMAEMAFMPLQIKTNIFGTQGGVKSGYQGTSLIDAALWFFIVYCAFCALAPKGFLANMHSFMENVRTKGVGDDLIIAVKKAIQDWFNPKTIGKWVAENTNLKVTSMKKDGTPISFEPIEDIEFCSRKFVPLAGHPSRIVPFLKTRSVASSLQWTSSPWDLKTFYDNAVANRTHILSYGKAKYSVFETELAKLAEVAGITDHTTHTYETYADFLWQRLISTPEENVPRPLDHHRTAKTFALKAIAADQAATMSQAAMKKARANCLEAAAASPTLEAFRSDPRCADMRKLPASLVQVDLYQINRPGHADGKTTLDLVRPQTTASIWCLAHDEGLAKATWSDDSVGCLPAEGASDRALRWNHALKIAQATHRLMTDTSVDRKGDWLWARKAMQMPAQPAQLRSDLEMDDRTQAFAPEVEVYVCECNQMFGSELEFKDHQTAHLIAEMEMTHTDDRPDGNTVSASLTSYRCDVCNVDFTTPRSRDNHILTADHQRNTKLSQQYFRKDTQQYYCPICNVACSGPVPMQQHVISAGHLKKSGQCTPTPIVGAPQLPTLRCDLCKIECNSERNYQQHLSGIQHAKALALTRKLQRLDDREDSAPEPTPITGASASGSTGSSAGSTSAAAAPNIAEPTPSFENAPAEAMMPVVVNEHNAADPMLIPPVMSFPEDAPQMTNAEDNDAVKAFQFNHLISPEINSSQAAGSVVFTIPYNWTSSAACTEFMLALARLGAQVSGTMQFEITFLSSQMQNGSIIIAPVSSTYRGITMTPAMMRSLPGHVELSAAGASRAVVNLCPTPDLMRGNNGTELWPTQDALDKDPLAYGYLHCIIGTSMSNQFGAQPLPVPIVVKARWAEDFRARGSRIMLGMSSGGGGGAALPRLPRTDSMAIDSDVEWFQTEFQTRDPFCKPGNTIQSNTLCQYSVATIKPNPVLDKGEGYVYDKSKRGTTTNNVSWWWGRLDQDLGDNSGDILSYDRKYNEVKNVNQNKEGSSVIFTTWKDGEVKDSTARCAEGHERPYNTNDHIWKYDGFTLLKSCTQVQGVSYNGYPPTGLNLPILTPTDDIAGQLNVRCGGAAGVMQCDELGNTGNYQLESGDVEWRMDQVLNEEGGNTEYSWIIDPVGNVNNQPSNAPDKTQAWCGIRAHSKMYDGNRFSIQGGLRCQSVTSSGTAQVPQGFVTVRFTGDAPFVPTVTATTQNRLTFPHTRTEMLFKQQVEDWFASPDRDCASYTVRIVTATGQDAGTLLVNEKGVFAYYDEGTTVDCYMSIPSTVGWWGSNYTKSQTKWPAIPAFDSKYLLPRTLSATYGYSYKPLFGKKHEIVHGLRTHGRFGADSALMDKLTSENKDLTTRLNTMERRFLRLLELIPDEKQEDREDSLDEYAAYMEELSDQFYAVHTADNGDVLIEIPDDTEGQPTDDLTDMEWFSSLEGLDPRITQILRPEPIIETTPPERSILDDWIIPFGVRLGGYKAVVGLPRAPSFLCYGQMRDIGWRQCHYCGYRPDPWDTSEDVPVEHREECYHFIAAELCDAEHRTHEDRADGILEGIFSAGYDWKKGQRDQEYAMDRIRLAENLRGKYGAFGSYVSSGYAEELRQQGANYRQAQKMGYQSTARTSGQANFTNNFYAPSAGSSFTGPPAPANAASSARAPNGDVPESTSSSSQTPQLRSSTGGVAPPRVGGSRRSRPDPTIGGLVNTGPRGRTGGVSSAANGAVPRSSFRGVRTAEPINRAPLARGAERAAVRPASHFIPPIG